MTPLSRRYIRPMLLLMAPALAPVIIHSYSGLAVEDCPGATALFPTAVSRDTRRDLWMRAAFQAVQWTEGRLSADDGVEASFMLVRSYDPKRLYHRPYNSFSEGAAADDYVEWLSGGSHRIPVHIVRYEKRAEERLTGYLLVYNGQAVADPYRAQIAAIPGQLLRGARPMTLFLISAGGPPGSEARMQSYVRRWLAAQWLRYQHACSLPGAVPGGPPQNSQSP